MSSQITITTLIEYYKKAFPSDDLYRWLSYGDDINFMRREFSFAIRDNALMRHLAFTSKEMMKVEFLRFAPIKIDIGAIYNASPACKKNLRIFPVEKELVVDIDLTDYGQRTCCIEADACHKCWKFATVAAALLKCFLTEDFGFEHILWVFSGRRGLHCWVSDEAARTLSSAQRQSMVKYLTILDDNEQPEQIAKMVRGQCVPYSIRRAMGIAESMFESVIVSGADVFGTEEGVEYFLRQLPDSETRSDVRNLFEKFNTSLERWKAFVSYFHDRTASETNRWQDGEGFLDALRLIYCHPRLDKIVTASDAHLLKSPFSVHPATGKISTPLRFEEIQDFDPRQAPTLKTALDEVDNACDVSQDDLFGHEESPGTFSRSLTVFHEFVNKLETDGRR